MKKRKMCIFCGKETGESLSCCGTYKGIVEGEECPKCGELVCAEFPCDCEPEWVSDKDEQTLNLERTRDLYAEG